MQYNNVVRKKLTAMIIGSLFVASTTSVNAMDSDEDIPGGPLPLLLYVNDGNGERVAHRISAEEAERMRAVIEEGMRALREMLEMVRPEDEQRAYRQVRTYFTTAVREMIPVIELLRTIEEVPQEEVLAQLLANHIVRDLAADLIRPGAAEVPAVEEEEHDLEEGYYQYADLEEEQYAYK